MEIPAVVQSEADRKQQMKGTAAKPEMCLKKCPNYITGDTMLPLRFIDIQCHL